MLVDERWCEISALSAGQCLGLGWMDAAHSSDRSILKNDWLRIVEQGVGSFRARFGINGIDGRTQPVTLQAVAEHDEAGAVRGYTLTLAVIPWDEASDDALREQREFFNTLASVAPVGS